MSLQLNLKISILNQLEDIDGINGQSLNKYEALYDEIQRRIWLRLVDFRVSFIKPHFNLKFFIFL